MQKDLESTFRYKVSFEKAMMPIWKLIAKPQTEKMIKTKTSSSKRIVEYKSGENTRGKFGFILKNCPIDNILDFASYFIKSEHPFLDYTGIKNNIDIDLDADMTDIPSIRKSLAKYGLDLVEGVKEMKVMVITDSNQRCKK